MLQSLPIGHTQETGQDLDDSMMLWDQRRQGVQQRLVPVIIGIAP